MNSLPLRRQGPREGNREPWRFGRGRDVEAVRSVVEELAEELSDLRPLPETAARVISLTQHEYFSMEELTEVISSDQALTAKLLRMANSAYYGFAREIGTVRDAVVLLGYSTVRSAALTASLLGSFPPTRSIDYREFWHFSVTVGLVAEMLDRAENARQDHAFTAGVLHDIGKLALDQSRPELLSSALDRQRQHHISLHDAELAVLGFTDAELGGALARRWRFPPELADAIEHHARPLQMIPDARSLTAITARARLIVQGHGCPDGLEFFALTGPTEDVESPSLATAFARSGGFDGVVEQAEAFIDAVLA